MKLQALFTYHFLLVFVTAEDCEAEKLQMDLVSSYALRFEYLHFRNSQADENFAFLRVPARLLEFTDGSDGTLQDCIDRCGTCAFFQ